MDTFPEIRITKTRLKVEISGEFEVVDRETANQVEADIDEALEILRRLGSAVVKYESTEEPG